MIAAYDTTDGTKLWQVRDPDALVLALAVTSDGTRLIATGTDKEEDDPSHDYTTAAYDATDGTKLWLARYSGPGRSVHYAEALALSPDGSRVFVTGSTYPGPVNGYTDDYLTVAYDASTGSQLWEARYTGPVVGGFEVGHADGASALAVSPDGSRVFVTGYSGGPGTPTDYATLAYDAANGRRIWEARYEGQSIFTDRARAVAVSPDGSRVFVTGSSNGDSATVAYDADDGIQLWVARYSDIADVPSPPLDLARMVEWVIGNTPARDIGVSPDGSRVFVSGAHATVAYCAAVPVPTQSCELLPAYTDGANSYQVTERS